MRANEVPNTKPASEKQTKGGKNQQVKIIVVDVVTPNK